MLFGATHNILMRYANVPMARVRAAHTAAAKKTVGPPPRPDSRELAGDEAREISLAMGARALSAVCGDEFGGTI